MDGRLPRRAGVAVATLGGAALLVLATLAGSAASAGQVAPDNSSPPTISGTAQQGRTLTASSGSWTGSTPISFAYQWLRCSSSGGSCSGIGGATTQTYTLTSSDVGATIRAQVKATNGDGQSTATSDPTAVVVAANAPVNTSPPAISGTALRGQTLSASNGSWTGSDPISFAYQWLRCNQGGGGCSTVGGATSETYALGGGDVGHTLRVQVTASNIAGSASVLSQPSAVVVSGSAPANTSAPSVSGAAVQGQTLALGSGSWNGTQPITFSYAWQRCDTNGNNCQTIAGATGSGYQVTADDVARRIRGQVTASNAVGSSSALSNLTDPVQGPPVLVSLPTITGTPAQGKALVATVGQWTSVSALSFTFQWARCDTAGANCAPVTGASPSLGSYNAGAADVGHRLIVQVKAMNASGASFANSKPTDLVQAAPAPPPPPPPPPGTSVPVADVALPDRLLVDRIRWVPDTIRSRGQTIIGRFHVSETAHGRPVSGALVYAIGVPFDRLTTPAEAQTEPDGWAQLEFRVLPTFALRRGNYVVVFVRARKPGENILAGVSTRRLVSITIG